MRCVALVKLMQHLLYRCCYTYYCSPLACSQETKVLKSKQVHHSDVYLVMTVLWKETTFFCCRVYTANLPYRLLRALQLTLSGIFRNGMA